MQEERTVRIGLVQKNVVIGDFPGNLERYRNGYDEAVQQGAELVVFPELATTGYPPRDLLALPDFIQANLSMVQDMASWTASGPPIIVGYIALNEEDIGNDLLNAAAVLQNGEQTATVHKSLLPSYDVFDEDRYFEHVLLVVRCTLGAHHRPYHLRRHLVLSRALESTTIPG